MPPMPRELELLIETLVSQIKTLAEAQEKLSEDVKSIALVQKGQEVAANEYIRKFVREQTQPMNDDISEIKKKLEEVEEKIISKQQEGYKRMIAVQTAILLSVVTAVITILTKVIFHM